MNEGVFSSYENFFCGSSLTSDLSVTGPIHQILESDYLKDISPTQQSQSDPLVQQQLSFHSQQLQSFGNGLSTNSAMSVQSALASTECASGGATGMAGNSSNGPNTFVNIPFVQIHTTDVQPQSGFNGNSFRRNASNNSDVIKSEPIKSENADAAKERMNTTPTPPRAVSTRNGICRNANANATSHESENVHNSRVSGTDENGGASEIPAPSLDSCSANLPAPLPTLHKCKKCPFISLNENELQEHDTVAHTNDMFEKRGTESVPIKCPGCENVFFVYNSISVHLREDHMMSVQNVEALLQVLTKVQAVAEPSVSDTFKSSSTANGSESIENITQRRSRIYLKNVECLREPRREPIEQQDNLINDNLFHFENDSPMMNIGMEEQDFIGILTNNNMENNKKSNHNNSLATEPALGKPANNSKQKISIKSVDVLREPALLRRDYEMQSFGSFMNVCSDLDLHAVNVNNDNNLENDIINSEQFNYCSQEREALSESNNEDPMGNDVNGIKKSRRPKIYIKNVDILKEPMTFTNNINTATMSEPTGNVMNFNFIQPALPQATATFMDTVENLNATVPTFNNGMSQLPMSAISEQYLFENSTNNFLGNTPTNAETFHYGSDQNSANFLMDTNRFPNPLDDDLNINHSSITPIITEPTPPPLTVATISSNTENPINTPTRLTLTQTAAAAQKQKIFIKNVDILKEPQFQEHRGTLHLRTVDELNLMNKIEVENLITPNLDNTQGNAGSTHCDDEMNENFTQLNANMNQLPEVGATNDTLSTLYEDNTFKLQEFSTQGVNGWSDDYDLGDDIGEIITDTIAPNLQSPQKIIHDLDTPQMSLISIRDIEELTGCQQDLVHNTYDCTSTELNSNNTVEPVQTENVAMPTVVCNAIEVDNLGESVKESEMNEALHLPQVTSGLKQERRAISANNGQQTPVAEKSTTAHFDDIPPLTPMTTTPFTIGITSSAVSQNASTSITTICRDVGSSSGLPVPPLVPMSPLIQLQKSGAPLSSSTTQGSPAERGRIYVANNLIQTQHLTSSQLNALKTPVAVSVTGGTSVRGRPFGSNRTGITKIRKHHENSSAMGVYLKCTIVGCAFRFRKSSTLEYHIRCHISESAPQSMQCPECKCTEFTNWNTLHTHLWRTHKIDMELYSCELCSFKTPIYSRLLNTHSKIHYDERNYKCDQCEKAFKNTKQLKNHRRWHRNHSKSAMKLAKEIGRGNEISPSTSGAPSAPTRTFHRCKDCDAVFSHQKTLREHLCKNATTPVQCDVCDRVLTSRSSLKLHKQSHESVRRFKCNSCDYTASDHNAFRRHKMTHENARTYSCNHCDYKSIQSVAYQKHVQQKHPQVADSVVYKCKTCPYATISKALFNIHQVKHEKKSDTSISSAIISSSTDDNSKSLEFSKSELIGKTKIKVKSHLLLTSPGATSEFNNLCLNTVIPA